MVIGLGTGSTATFAIEEVSRRIRDGLAISAIATSERTAGAAREAGIPLLDFQTIDVVDLCIDGVDEIDPILRAIKGGGGAMLREKIVAQAARRMIAIADATKPVKRLGARPVPLEVLPFAATFVQRRVGELGCVPTLRLDSKVPFRTDQGNVVIDCALSATHDLEWLAVAFSSIAGVLGHGLFLHEIDTLYVGQTDGSVERRDRPDGA